MDYSLSGSSIHRIFHVRVLEWVAIAFSNKTRLGPLFAELCDKIQIKIRKIASTVLGLPYLFFLDGRKQTLKPDDCRF